MVLLGCSAAALACAPLVLPKTYSWVEHTTSEGAGQGVSGAWLARTGFVCFGAAVLWISANARQWGWLARWLHAAFGAFMIAAAIFSSRQWEEGAAFDHTEDLLHSIAASTMGVAFAVGVAAVAVRRWWMRTEAGVQPLDVIAITASALIPLTMIYFDPIAGLLQRMMFTIAYVWYAKEGLATTEGPERVPG